MTLRPALAFPLYLARHGETEFNVQRRWQGSRNDSPLTARGRAQARDSGLVLRDLIAPDMPPRFVASPQPRARATMEIVLETLGLARDRYSTDARLVEIDVGEWSGCEVETVKATDARWHARQADRWNLACPGGESYCAAAARAKEWLEEVREPMIVVSHGALGRILRGLYLGLTPDEIFALEEPQGCVFRLEGGTIAKFAV
jgi:broad specificity phosphatase PhoE